ncbi:MAG TPA: hypothetical protein VH575_31975 [Gemmataceae bacterium]|jgi:hypothetical protein
MSNSQCEAVLATVRRQVSEAEVPVVMEMLDRYGTQANEPERDRVYLAILKLSAG